MNLKDIRTKLYADVANVVDLGEMLRGRPAIQGVVVDLGYSQLNALAMFGYRRYIAELLEAAPDLPICLPVPAMDASMALQAGKLSDLSPRVYASIPVTDTSGNSNAKLAKQLAVDGIQVCVTEAYTLEQAQEFGQALEGSKSAIFSMNAGDLMDIGIDPVERLYLSTEFLPENVMLMWADCRGVWNVVQANAIGCDIVAVKPKLFNRLPLLDGHTADERSLVAVRQRYDMIKKAGLNL
jgi:transaldolase